MRLQPGHRLWFPIASLKNSPFAKTIASNRLSPRSSVVTRILPIWPKFLSIGFAAGLVLASCARGETGDGSGDARAGAVEITRNACGSCHEIPGVEEAIGRVGPSLRHFAGRRMIAGRLANTQANLERWLRAPQVIAPGNAMPDQSLTEQQARDIAAYLERLK